MENRYRNNEAALPSVFKSLYQEMTEGLALLQRGEHDPVMVTARKSIQFVRATIERLRNQVVNHPFNSNEDEIQFFKHTKPLFHSHLIFWMGVFNIELRRPVGSKKAVEKYLLKELQKLTWFFSSNGDFYCYFRSGETSKDEVYFLREKPDDSAYDLRSIDRDRSFSTSCDYLVARILANEMLKEYLDKALQELEQAKAEDRTMPPELPLKWTASKAGLVELIYALQSGGVYNNGNAEIKEIAECFGTLFQVDLGNYYHIFNEIRLRKKSRTQLLDQLKEKVAKKMDDMDEG